MTVQDQDELQSASFNVMGTSFNLKLRKKEIPALSQAVKDVQERSSALLRSNPGLSPHQAAILVALNLQTDLNECLCTNTPFEDKAFELVHKARGILNEGFKADPALGKKAPVTTDHEE